jgi:peptidyl-prolyl cis-trans isomerase SurA
MTKQRIALTFNTVYPYSPSMNTITLARTLVSLACLCGLNLSFAQGIRLESTPAITIRAPASATSNATAPAVIQADYIVAVVNSEPVTNHEIKTRLIRYERRLAEQGAILPSRADLSKEVLEDIIREKIQLKLARDSGVRIDDKTLEAALQNFAQQNNITLDELRKRASVDGIGFTQIRSDVQNQLLIQKLRERDVLGNIAVSENDIETFLKEQLSKAPPAEVMLDLAQILVEVPETATAPQVQALQERATRILTRARNGEDFSKLAQENSDAQDARSGGRMGLRSLDRIPTLFIEATQDLKIGGIAGPVRSGAGFHVLKILDKQQAATTLSVKQTSVRHILLRTSATLSEDVAKTRLVELKKRIESGALDFMTAAKQNSQDGSAAAGGALGWAGQGQFVPEFENAMNQLSERKVSDPVVSRFGVHLILVEARRQTEVNPLEQREAARNLLREKKFEETYADWIRNLRSNAYVEYREARP